MGHGVVVAFALTGPGVVCQAELWGVDDFEWGVTLFGQRPDDLKDVVYTMRYDHASAVYGEFGVFYAGMVADLDTVLAGIGRR